MLAPLLTTNISYRRIRYEANAAGLKSASFELFQNRRRKETLIGK